MKHLTIMPAVMIPLAAAAQSAAQQAARPQPGQHFGLSDEVWLYLFMITAVVFTMIIITINTAIRNLAESKSLWKPKNVAMMVMFFLAGNTVFGQSQAAPDPRFILSDSAFWGLASANLFLMFYALMQLRLLRNVTRKVAGLDAIEPNMTPLMEGPSWFARFWMRINDLKEPEQEKDLLLNHEYDGIRELDNNLPPWWKWTFYLSIIFGVVYLAHFHVLKTGALPKEELAQALAKAEEEVAAFKARARLNVDETNVVYLLEEERLTAGASIYKVHCAVCHGQQGEGGVGPNLADQYWVHGGTISDVFRTIKYGVPAKGMQAWNNNLTAIQIQNVSTYIMAMQGSEPPNPKEPQGEFVEPAVPQGHESPDPEDGRETTDEDAPTTAQSGDDAGVTVSLK